MNQESIETLHGIGPALAKRLGYLGIQTVADIVWYIPRAYDDRSDVAEIGTVAIGEKVTVSGTIEKIASRRGWKSQKSITEALLTDDSGSLKILWFNQPFIAQNLHVGDHVLCTGIVKKNAYGIALQSPEYEKVIPGRSTTHAGRIVPQYTLTAGITQKQMRYIVKQALEKILPLPDPLPEVIQKTYSLLPLSEALSAIHFPKNNGDFYQAQYRLDFQELYIQQLAVQALRAEIMTHHAPEMVFQQQAIQTFVEQLPFTLTAAQKKAAWSVLQDMEKPHPMNRLVEGDVGSGKTVVAAMAILNTVLNGYQAVLMAPTEIVAKQHYQTISTLFTKNDISISLRTGSEKNDTNADVLIGTHALIQASVHIPRLGLAVIDEQHRFGVAQRQKLKEQQSRDGKNLPHLLSMSATPIPRSLALTLYGDLDLSVIDEMPVGRKPVITRIVQRDQRERAYDFVRKKIAQGKQAFVICPVIEESEKLRVKAVTTEYERLQNGPFATLRLEMLHGKMKPAEKEKIMRRMHDKKIDILVTTSVIEVGVDIPNATIMIIEGAERFGLAQLHQLRGRVGRSDEQSYCFLFTTSDAQTTIARLQVMTTVHNGFLLAQKDLELRGSGELYGTMQSGFSEHMVHALQQPLFIETVQQAVQKTLTEKLIHTTTLLQEQVEARRKKMHLE